MSDGDALGGLLSTVLVLAVAKKIIDDKPAARPEAKAAPAPARRPLTMAPLRMPQGGLFGKKY
jgi:hypothetical protein